MLFWLLGDKTLVHLLCGLGVEFVLPLVIWVDIHLNFALAGDQEAANDDQRLFDRLQDGVQLESSL